MALRRFTSFGAGLAMAVSMAAFASAAIAAPADWAEGQYVGAITADQKGQPQQSVTIFVVKIADDEVNVECSCDRIPKRKFKLQESGDAIQGSNGQDSIKLEASKLDLRIDGATFSGAPDDNAGGMTAPK